MTITDIGFTKESRDLSTYVQNSFHMFGGEDEWITLQFQFKQEILNGVIDKFGRDADIRKGENDTFILKAKAKLSQGLKGWILAWGSQVKVISPQKLADDIYEEAKKIMELYQKQG